MFCWEKAKLRFFLRERVEGPLRLPPEIFGQFLAAPEDVLPDFAGPAHLRGGRGKDHPRYGRWVYAFAKVIRPEHVVEVGTYAGGTAVAWARALRENGRGALHCIDNDTYTEGTFPDTTTKNLRMAGLPEDRFSLLSGDSRKLVPELGVKLKRQVDAYLVDGDHHYQPALDDISNGLPMMRPGGYVLVHDVDRHRRMDEATPEHPEPVHEAFMQAVRENGFTDWCILKFIRKHLGIIRMPGG
jgi:predicted O-methyltransferase YrrM